MGEYLEPWSDRTPERPRALGIAHQVARMREEAAAAAEADAEAALADPPASRRERGAFVTHLMLPWSYGDRESRDLWKRMRCRWGRHDMVGGHPVQIGGEVVFIELQCRWCQLQPG